MRVEPNYIVRLRPWSLPALLVALLAIGAATAARMILASLGLPFYFATFFPAVLAAGLIAGAPAGAFTAVLAIPIVWWAFMPPVFPRDAPSGWPRQFGAAKSASATAQPQAGAGRRSQRWR